MGVNIADTFGQHADQDEPQLRRLVLTPASTIKPRRVRWIWDKRIAYGTLALLAGREGLGKSTLAYHIAATITRGTLEGEDHGSPRAVLVCASEDSWEHTIVPRLIAAGADLDRIYRVEMVTIDNMHLSISLPRDFHEVQQAAADVDAGLMILDPLMSVIDEKLDTHRDREVRRALEPLVGLAEHARMAIIGLIHHNKSGSTDALQLVMGSKAFSAVARSVHTCIPDPDDENQERRLFATSKNNLGRLDLPVLGFTITSHAVETEDDGTAWTGRLHWTGEVEGNMHEIMTRSADPERSATGEAADWLRDYLTSQGGEAAKTDIEKAGRVAGHSTRTLGRARERLHLEHHSWGFPRRTFWSLPGAIATTGDDKPDDFTEPRHPPDDTSGPDTSRASNTPHVSPSASRANYNTDTDEHASRATVVPILAPLGTTDPDLHKHQDEPFQSLARARAREESQVGTTEDLAQLDSTVVPTTRTPRARGTTAEPTPTRLAPPGPPCPDCAHPLDSDQHANICEDQP